jgi:hypothetical protein
VSTKGQKSHQHADQRAAAPGGQKPRTYESAAADRKAELDAVRDRTERLKALRLEHEARLQQLLRNAETGKGRAASRGRAGSAKRAKEPEKKITLADWLAQQRASGRET